MSTSSHVSFVPSWALLQVSSSLLLCVFLLQVSWDDVKCTYGRSDFNWYANVSLVSPDAALDFGMRGSKEREDKWFGLHVAWGVVGMQEICQSGFLHAFWFVAS